jgi:DbpA-like RNA binding protein
LIDRGSGIQQFRNIGVSSDETGENFGPRPGDVNRHALTLVFQPSDPHAGEIVPSFEELHIQPSIAQALEQRGWKSDTPEVRETAPTAARGHNLVVVSPPLPVYTTPALAGMLSRLQRGRRALVIVPSVQLDEWAALVSGLAQSSQLRIQVARGAARAMRRLRAEELEVIVTSFDTAAMLVSRSALRMETVDALLLAWPELLPEDDAVMPLMQDLPKEAQRIVYTSEPARVAGLVERYARKALTVGAPQFQMTSSAPVRTVSASWNGRVRALAEAIELLDPSSLVVWTLDSSYHQAIRLLISEDQTGVQLVTGDAPPAGTIVAFDLPTPSRLGQLVESGEVVLLVPPGTESYVRQLGSKPRPLQLAGPLDAARSAEQQQRSQIQRAIEAAVPASRSLLTLAPLFERYDATTVAAALFDLWRGSTPSSSIPEAAPSATAKVYVGAGKKDGVTANDLVAVLTKELRVDRTQIGRIELRDSYSLIELPAQDAERLAGQLNGTTIRRKRVSARVDRGPTRPGAEPRESRRPAGRANRG